MVGRPDGTPRMEMTKLLPLLVMPSFVGLALALAGCVLRVRPLTFAGVGVVWLASTPLAERAALQAIEAGQGRGPVADAPAADLIVVLSEGRHRAPGPARVSEWTDADRFFAGVELALAGRAPHLVFTGGGSTTHAADATEGEWLRWYAIRFGVPQERVVVTGLVTSTEEEADAVACLVQGAPRDRVDDLRRASTVLLVTSAFHMPRAAIAFERRGFEVVPFPVDFRAPAPRPLRWTDVVPRGGSLRHTELAWREFIGRIWQTRVVATPRCTVAR